MTRLKTKSAFWLSVAFAAVAVFSNSSVFGQPVYTRPTTTTSPTPKPYIQDIQVPSATPVPSNPGQVTRTSSVNAADVSPADASVPGYSGILVESLDGKVIVDNSSNFAFNPASNVKIATTYAVIKTFGPNFRFQTTFWTDGQIDPETRTLNGNLYISGRDPMFNLEHAINAAYEMNRLGISTISGSVIVTDNFALNYSMSPANSAAQFSTAIDSSRRSAVAARAWQNYLANSGKFGTITLIPSVSVVGKTFVQPVPGNVRQLFTHESAPLREIVKVMMCFSNNFISERLGDTVGGPYRVAQISQQAAGVSPAEFILQTSSGLGVNRVTPRAMMKLMRALRFELARHKMTFADVMPVAGIDKGTLAGRFASDFAPGNVVGKTGTLGNTDAGVSALSGEMHTRQGTFLFVIFNQRGSVPRFRAFQNSYITNLQNQLGGAAPSPYNPISLDVRLANTRITYPEMRARIN